MASHQNAQRGSGSGSDESVTEPPGTAETGPFEIADISDVEGGRAPPSSYKARSRTGSAPRSLVPSENSQSGRSTEISEELLELLRRIHDKLFEDEEPEPVAGTPKNEESRRVSDLKWYENTHRGVDFLGKIYVRCGLKQYH